MDQAPVCGAHAMRAQCGVEARSRAERLMLRGLACEHGGGWRASQGVRARGWASPCATTLCLPNAQGGRVEPDRRVGATVVRARAVEGDLRLAPLACDNGHRPAAPAVLVADVGRGRRE
eukprot:5075427-Pleurochrysis_carterae.AAC.1